MALQTLALLWAACRAWTAYSSSGMWVCFTGQPCTVQEYKGQGSKVPLYLGFRPANGLFVELEGWNPAYRIASVGCSLTRCTPPWRSERADVIISAPLQGRLIYSNNRVHGNRTLYAEARSYHYKLYLYTCWFLVLLPRGDVEGGNSEVWLIYIQLTIIQCCSNFCYIVTSTALY